MLWLCLWLWLCLSLGVGVLVGGGLLGWWWWVVRWVRGGTVVLVLILILIMNVGESDVGLDWRRNFKWGWQHHRGVATGDRRREQAWYVHWVVARPLGAIQGVVVAVVMGQELGSVWARGYTWSSGDGGLLGETEDENDPGSPNVDEGVRDS